LNEVTRKKEIEEAEKKKAANDKLDTKVVGKEGTPVDVMHMDDEYLREGLFVLGDLITTKLG
jgi:carboxyl-terminal processing protease